MNAPQRATSRDGRPFEVPSWGKHPLIAGALGWGSRHSVFLAFAVFFVFALLAMVAWLPVPLAYDVSLYMHYGQIVFDGGVPYVDFADNKGPLNSVFFGVVDLATFSSWTAVRLTLVLAIALSALALGGVVARTAGREVGFVAGAALALFAAVPAVEGFAPNTEQYGMACILGAWWAGGHQAKWGPPLAGGLFACAALINPVFAPFVALIGWEIWRTRPGAWRPALLRAITGGAVVVLSVAAWLLLGGAIDDMRGQLGAQGRAFGIGNLLDRFTSRAGLRGLIDVPIPAVWGLAIAGSALAMTRRQFRALAVAVLLIMFVVWLRIKGANYVFLHHWYPALPALAAGIALGLARVWPLSDDRRLRRLAIAAVVLVAPVLVYTAQPQARLLGTPVNERWGVDHPYTEAIPAARFIDSQLPEDATIYVAGGGPAIHWITGRRAPTRWLETPPVRWMTSANVEERRQDLLIDPPQAIAALPGARIDPAIRDVMARFSYRTAYTDGDSRVWIRDD